MFSLMLGWELNKKCKQHHSIAWFTLNIYLDKHDFIFKKGKTSKVCLVGCVGVWGWVGVCRGHSEYLVRGGILQLAGSLALHHLSVFGRANFFASDYLGSTNILHLIFWPGQLSCICFWAGQFSRIWLSRSVQQIIIHIVFDHWRILNSH